MVYSIPLALLDHVILFIRYYVTLCNLAVGTGMASLPLLDGIASQESLEHVMTVDQSMSSMAELLVEQIHDSAVEVCPKDTMKGMSELAHKRLNDKRQKYV